MTQHAQPKFAQWVETAEALGRGGGGSVGCPCCGSPSLSMRDMEYGFGHEKGIQRYISCACCGAFTGVNVRRAGEPQRESLRAAE